MRIESPAVRVTGRMGFQVSAVQEQVESTHPSPGAHSVAQPPQCDVCRVVSTQAPPHESRPSGQTQVDAMQAEPAGQAAPHAPQERELEVTSTQPPSAGQKRLPAGQTQLPSTQLISVGQVYPHKPQFVASDDRSTQPADGQLAIPSGHAQTPSTQSTPGSHASPHPPQCSMLERTSTQPAPAHSLSPTSEQGTIPGREASVAVASTPASSDPASVHPEIRPSTAIHPTRRISVRASVSQPSAVVGRLRDGQGDPLAACATRPERRVGARSRTREDVRAPSRARVRRRSRLDGVPRSRIPSPPRDPDPNAVSPSPRRSTRGPFPSAIHRVRRGRPRRRGAYPPTPGP